MTPKNATFELQIRSHPPKTLPFSCQIPHPAAQDVTFKLSGSSNRPKMQPFSSARTFLFAQKRYLYVARFTSIHRPKTLPLSCPDGLLSMRPKRYLWTAGSTCRPKCYLRPTAVQKQLKAVYFSSVAIWTNSFHLRPKNSRSYHDSSDPSTLTRSSGTSSLRYHLKKSSDWLYSDIWRGKSPPLMTRSISVTVTAS